MYVKITTFTGDYVHIHVCPYLLTTSYVGMYKHNYVSVHCTSLYNYVLCCSGMIYVVSGLLFICNEIATTSFLLM